MRESIYVLTGAIEETMEDGFHVPADNGQKEESMPPLLLSFPPFKSHPQISPEDRRDVLPSTETRIHDEDEDHRSVDTREAMHREDSLESAPAAMDSQTLSNVLVRKEEEIKRLQAELEQARNQLKENKDQEFIVDCTTKFRETVEEWNRELLAKQGQDFVHQAEILTRDHAILRLNEALVRANRRVSELEVKLEFHDFKFVSHEKHLREETGKLLLYPQLRRAGKTYTEKLVSDLEEIEKLYISAKQDFAVKVERLQQDCDKYKAKCLSMEKDIMSSNLSPQSPHYISGVEERDDLGVPRIFMRQMMRHLETELKAQRQLTACLQNQVEDLSSSNRTKEKKQTQEIQTMARRKASLESKVAALQKQSNSGWGVFESAEYESLVANMDELLLEIARLEARLRTKERIISKLQEKLSTEMQDQFSPTEGVGIICGPLPNNFDEKHQDRCKRMSGQLLEDEPSI